MREIKINQETAYKIRFCDRLIFNYRNKLADELLPVKKKLDDAELALDEALFRWTQHYGKPFDKVEDRNKEEVLETSKLAFRVEEILKEFKRIDQHSELSVSIKKYSSMREQYIDEVCKEIKALPEHIDSNTLVAKIPDDFDYDKISVEILSKRP